MTDTGNKNIEFTTQKQGQKDSRKTRFRDILDGSLLTRDNVVSQLPYVLFLTFLLILYIGNRYHSERVIRQSLQLQSELKELRARSIYMASELEYLSNQSQVSRLVEQRNLGLKYSEEPPVKIVSKNRKKRK